MGKVHRIKRRFRKIVSKPLKSGNYHVGGARFYIGIRNDKSVWFMSLGVSYNKLIKKLEREYRDGVGLSD
jgi:hypothetical protein